MIEKRIFGAAHYFFWISIPFICLAGILSNTKNLNLQWHDSYFVINAIHLAYFISIVFGFFGIIYWSLRNARLGKWLSFVHFIFTSLPLITIIVIFTFKSNLNIGIENFRKYEWLDTAQLICIGLLFIAQCIFVLNLLFAWLRRKEHV